MNVIIKMNEVLEGRDTGSFVEMESQDKPLVPDGKQQVLLRVVPIGRPIYLFYLSLDDVLKAAQKLSL